jgi:hypothetical protein
MNDITVIMAVRFRESAAHYRELAQRAGSLAEANELQSTAEQYERDAARLEREFEARSPIGRHGARKPRPRR